MSEKDRLLREVEERYQKWEEVEKEYEGRLQAAGFSTGMKLTERNLRVVKVGEFDRMWNEVDKAGREFHEALRKYAEFCQKECG